MLVKIMFDFSMCKFRIKRKKHKNKRVAYKAEYLFPIW